MISIQPVIVIYNTYAGDSVSVISMIEQNARPIIIDNSTSDYNNQNYCEKNGLTYVSMNGNAGLSKAYNRAVSIINDDVDYILLDSYNEKQHLHLFLNIFSLFLR